MIFNNNRVSALGEVEVEIPVKESFLGMGVLNFIQESYNDELEVFTAAILSDINEAEEEKVIDAEYTEKEDKGEDKGSKKNFKEFVAQAQAKIEKLMKDLIAWIKGIIDNVMAKIEKAHVQYNEKFCKDAQDKASKTTLVVPAKCFKEVKGVDKYISEVFNDVKKAGSLAEKGGESELESLKKIQEVVAKMSVKDFLDKSMVAGEGSADAIFDRHIEIVKGARASIVAAKKDLKEIQAEATKIYKAAKKAGKDNSDKEAAHTKVQAASVYQGICKKFAHLVVSILNKETSTAKKVVIECLKGKAKEEAKNEEFEFDVEYFEALSESMDFELEMAVEDMSPVVEEELPVETTEEE